MGARYFMHTAYGKSAISAFDALCREAEGEYGMDIYNGTISTTNLSKTIRFSEKYSEAVEKRARKEISKENIYKRDCICYDLGAVEYQVISYKKISHTDNPPKYAMKYVVCEYDDCGRTHDLESYDTKKQADDYALSLLKKDSSKCLEVQKKQKRVAGNPTVTEFKREVKKYKTKPKKLPEGSTLVEKHKYIFVGMAAE